jgi:rhodanese-related sulfurtransferase
VADYCKKTFITAAGKLSPMKMHKDIETFGELEVLEFLEEMQDDKQMLFVDSRKTQWFESLTIPSAINIPFIYFTERDKWTKEKKEALKRFGVKGEKAPYDFSKSKTILFFCNGVWCRQSPQMIEALLELGYPPQKMKWYRGGMQSWMSVGMTSTRTPQ